LLVKPVDEAELVDAVIAVLGEGSGRARPAGPAQE
jgi:hypothetical protein